MNLPGADYLLRLSAIAVAFVGWAAIVVTLRKALGAELSPLHMFYVRLFIEFGLSVAAFCLLPAALSFTGLAGPTIWQICSASAALFYTFYLSRLYRRRLQVTVGKFPLFSQIMFAISDLATLALWVNIIGIQFQPGPAIYVIAFTWLLIVGGWVFAHNLELFFGNTPPKKD